MDKYQKCTEFSERVIGENNAFRFSQNFVSWFDNWINSAYNFQIYFNLLISLLIIWILNKAIYRKIPGKYSVNEKISFLLIISIAITFLLSPTLRYGFGVF